VAKAPRGETPDIEARKLGERYGFDTHVVQALNDDGWSCHPPGGGGAQQTRQTIRLASTIARLKTKWFGRLQCGWWMLWINAKQRAQPYQGLHLPHGGDTGE
jgi:hypothetical protein